jgi:hypothetical protein
MLLAARMYNRFVNERIYTTVIPSHEAAAYNLLLLLLLFFFTVHLQVWVFVGVSAQTRVAS